ncbi:hypothetical protein DPMN_003724 [Dreissena polymorpha]|uniref:Uncharacterized protein n=1 Tax=Dreissena polymorpha TaxID=45954 RepID=A0A9D4MLH8_DREPO|nr:hypothetical protein DPMN_003724 [Dreissena polymorpha]
MLNKSLAQGAASLNLGFQTFLPKGRDYLIHKESTSIDIVLAQQQHQSGMHEPQSRTTLPLP